MEIQAPPRLSVLTNLTQPSPPSISEIIDLTLSAQDYNYFKELAAAYTPDIYDSIIAQNGSAAKVSAFANQFSEKYFPLAPYFRDPMDTWEEDEYSIYTRFLSGIPYELHGFDYEDLHDIWEFSTIPLAALALLPQPPEGHFMANPWEDLRTAWLESANRYIPEDTLKLLPETGFPIETIKQTVKNSQFEGLLSAIAWIFADSNNLFVDASLEDYDGFVDPWEEETVQLATETWQEAKVILDQAIELANWLDSDLPNRFRQLVEHILSHSDYKPPTGENP